MSKAIYIATSEAFSGKSIITIGLMKHLLGTTPKVGFYRPIIDDLKGKKRDNHINTMLTYFNIDCEHDEAYAFTLSDFVKLRNRGKEGEIYDKIIDKYKKLEEKFDFIIVEGTDFSGDGAAIELDANILIAKNLGIPAILVSSGIGKTNEELIGNLLIAYESFKEKEVDVISIVANKVEESELETIENDIKAELDDKSILVSVIPLISALKNPSIKEIAESVDGTFLFDDNLANNQVNSIKVGAMQLRNHLTHLQDNSLVITSGDRADMILGLLQANISLNYPKVSGIVLTGGLQPEPPIMKLIDGLAIKTPIISTKYGTFETSNRIGAVKSHIYADNTQKIELSIETFEKSVDIDGLVDKFHTFEPDGMTPRMFQYNLIKKAKETRKRIVLPEANDLRILQATAQLIAADVVDITLLGDPEIVNEIAYQNNINLDGVDIINPIDSPKFEEYANEFYELRKHKNITKEMARDVMIDVSYFGTMMVYKGDVDGMVSGAAHTTQHTIRPALQFVKTKPGVNVVSSIFFMCLEDRVSIFGDCAINPNPNAEQLAEIAISSAESSIAFGIEPKIAMLSYSSGSSGKGADVDKVREATEIIKKTRPDLKVEGPIQYDAAVDKRVGKSKLPDSEVAGEASVLIFPDLNTGNNTYKAVQRETGALAIGPMLQGLNKPVNDLSRGCTVDDIFNTVVITAIQSQD